MRITKKMKWRYIEPLLNETNFDKVLAQCPERPLKKKIIELNCGQFISLMNNDVKMLAKIIGKPRYAIEMLGRMKSLKRQMEEISAYLTANDYKQDAMIEKAAAGVRFPTPSERILLDVQQRYGLHSLNDAEKAPLTDYLLMAKDQTAKAKFENNLSILQSKKYKKK